MITTDVSKRLKIYELSQHEFLTKDIKDFKLINVKKNLEEIGQNDQNEIKEEDNKHLCVICKLDKPEIILSPCGHKCICESCYYKLKVKNIKKCPICKRDIISIVKKVFEV